MELRAYSVQDVEAKHIPHVGRCGGLRAVGTATKGEKKERKKNPPSWDSVEPESSTASAAERDVRTA